MSLRILQVDAFTDRPFAGNPAAVCVLPAPRPERWMQDVAREMNLSETAFLVRRPDGFDLRWFTPSVEVKLCGHATLASAHVLFETGQLGPQEIARFHTKSGVLTARRAGDEIELDFPADPLHAAEPSPDLLAALNVSPVFVGRGRADWLVELKDESAVLAARPDFGRLKALSTRGVIVTARAATPPYDFVSRFFAPAAGIDEDPVTGSAHCTLACHWHDRTGKSEFRAFQASARGGELGVVLKGDQVLLRGRAVTVMDAALVAGA
jgi:PhzF family phenazine biosynthesis protein